MSKYKFFVNFGGRDFEVIGHVKDSGEHTRPRITLADAYEKPSCAKRVSYYALKQIEMRSNGALRDGGIVSYNRMIYTWVSDLYSSQLGLIGCAISTAKADKIYLYMQGNKFSAVRFLRELGFSVREEVMQ